MNTPPAVTKPAEPAADPEARITLTVPADITGDVNLGDWPDGQGPEIAITISPEALTRRIRQAVDDGRVLAELIRELNNSEGDFPGDPRLGERKIALPLTDGDPSVTITVAVRELTVLIVDGLADQTPLGASDPSVRGALADMAAQLRRSDH